MTWRDEDPGEVEELRVDNDMQSDKDDYAEAEREEGGWLLILFPTISKEMKVTE